MRRHELAPFNVQVQCVERTLCEKIMGLVRAGHESNPIAHFRRRIRHFYDLVMIMRANPYRDFVDSDAFVELMVEVRKSDRQSMPGARAWLDPPLSQAMIVAGAESLWGEIRTEFHGSFRDMVYGDSLPNDTEVLACLAAIGSSLAKV